MSSMAALLSGTAAAGALAPKAALGAGTNAQRGQEYARRNPSVVSNRWQQVATSAAGQRPCSMFQSRALACSQGSRFFQGETRQLRELADAVTRVPLNRRRHEVVRAAEGSEVPAFKGFPPMQTKPAFYWRMMAIIPYLLPLCEGWMYSETACSLQPFLEAYEVLSMPFLYFLGRLPGWFLLAYFFTAFLGVVRNNRWPHFVRFHFITGMLLEILLQVIGTANDWIPPSLYWGKIGAHFWLAISFTFVFIVVECILCALKGHYADVPFISDAAYMQIPYE